MSQSFTLVFEGSIRDFKQNPFTCETPFGVAYAAGIGNAFEEADALREALEMIRREYLYELCESDRDVVLAALDRRPA